MNNEEQMMDFGIIERLFALSPHILMMVVISIFLRFLKMSRFARQEDWLFGVLAMIIGGIFYPQIAEIGKVSYNVKYPMMILVMWGAALGGVTVTIHDTIWRFISKRFGIPSGSTEFTVRSKEETPSGTTIERVTTTTVTPSTEPQSKESDEKKNDSDDGSLPDV